MPVTFTEKPASSALPIHMVTRETFQDLSLEAAHAAWAKANGFSGQEGRLLVLPNTDGASAGALFGIATTDNGFAPLAIGTLARQLPEGDWYFAAAPQHPDLAALGVMLGSYQFDRYKKSKSRSLAFVAPAGCDAAAVQRR